MGKMAEIEKEGIYLYCIIRHSGNIEFGPIGIGNRNDSVYAINFKDICAIVSNSTVMRYEARRTNLLAHQLVLEEVMKNFSILPIRFSTISESYNQSKIVNILEKEYDKFSDLLNKMEGKKELGLKVMTLEEPFFKYILDRYEDIRSLKERIASLSLDKAHYQLIRIGEMVEEALINENLKFSNTIIDALSPIAEDVKVNDKYNNYMILNAAFLIKKEKEMEFDQAINTLDGQYGHLLKFKYVGSLPPYNFVNLIINTQED